MKDWSRQNNFRAIYVRRQCVWSVLLFEVKVELMIQRICIVGLWFELHRKLKNSRLAKEDKYLLGKSSNDAFIEYFWSNLGLKNFEILKKQDHITLLNKKLEFLIFLDQLSHLLVVLVATGLVITLQDGKIYRLLLLGYKSSICLEYLMSERIFVVMKGTLRKSCAWDGAKWAHFIVIWGGAIDSWKNDFLVLFLNKKRALGFKKF